MFSIGCMILAYLHLIPYIPYLFSEMGCYSVAQACSTKSGFFLMCWFISRLPATYTWYIMNKKCPVQLDCIPHGIVIKKKNLFKSNAEKKHFPVVSARELVNVEDGLFLHRWLLLSACDSLSWWSVSPLCIPEHHQNRSQLSLPHWGWVSAAMTLPLVIRSQFLERCCVPPKTERCLGQLS